VLTNEAYLPLENSFLLIGEPERNCVRVRLLGKIVMVGDMEGRERPHLEVVRLIHIQSVKCDQ
jgi:hypothetical protein